MMVCFRFTIVYSSIAVYLMPNVICSQNKTFQFINKPTLSDIDSPLEEFIVDAFTSVMRIVIEKLSYEMFKTSSFVPNVRTESFLELAQQTITNNAAVRANMTIVFEYQVAVVSFFRTAGIHVIPMDLPYEYLRKYLAVEIQTESIALLDMAVDLRTMMQMNRIFLNATMYSTEHFLVKHALAFVESIVNSRIVDEILEFIADIAFPTWLALVVESVERDPYLKNQFENKKVEARAYIDTNPTPIILENGEDSLYNEAWMKSHAPVYVIFHKTRSILEFPSNTFDNDETRPYCFIRALVEVATETTENADKLNAIFHEFMLNYPVSPYNDKILNKGDELFVRLQTIVENVDFKMAEKIKMREEMFVQVGLYKQLRRQQPLVSPHKTSTFSWTSRSNGAYDERTLRPLRKIRVPRTYVSSAY